MIKARAFLEAAQARGLSTYSGVPCSLLTPFINGLLNQPGLDYVMAANEGDAVGIAAGAALAGKWPVVMMQNSGLGNAVNPLTSLTATYHLPLLLIVTWRGDPAQADEPQHQLMGQITPSLLEQMQIPWTFFPTNESAIGTTLDRICQTLQQQRPFALLMRAGSVEPEPLLPNAIPAADTAAQPGRHYRPGLLRHTREQALRHIIASTNEQDSVVIATTGHCGRQLYALADRLNHFYMIGSMGCASAIGLGLARQRPDLKVVVVDGDGAALMRLGNLATVGHYGPENLVHIILDNQVHDSTGGQFTVSPGVSFAQVALGCGYAAACEGDDLKLLDRVLTDAAGDGPCLLQLKIQPGITGKLPRPQQTPVELRQRLMAHLARQQLPQEVR